MFDFTIRTYSDLLKAISSNKYFSQTFEAFIQKENSFVKNVVLRHDVDRLPQNALKLAQIENVIDVKGSYYFRVVPASYDLEIMNKIAGLGHEIGYHYEDVDLVIKNYKLKIKNDQDKEKLIDLAFESFCNHVEMLRRNFDIKTICMHGSPLSKYDNRLLWSKYQYQDCGVLADAYLGTDFNEVFYLTDAGRSWNNRKVSVRDHVETNFDIPIRSIHDIFKLIDNGDFPDKLMLNIHAHNWSDNIVDWVKVWGWQNSKTIYVDRERC